jgi:hypothetical protein
MYGESCLATRLSKLLWLNSKVVIKVTGKKMFLGITKTEISARDVVN